MYQSSVQSHRIDARWGALGIQQLDPLSILFCNSGTGTMPPNNSLNNTKSWKVPVIEIRIEDCRP
jgi:hypothetical protein